MKSVETRSAAQSFFSCTFCGKHQLDVAKLMHVTPDLTICVECIDLMHATIHGYAPTDPPPPPGSLKERLAKFYKNYH
jgi:ATP-dependent protease Clp ATPase subunit